MILFCSPLPTPITTNDCHPTGHPPDPVKNFKCRSYNWQYMECHFEAPMNTILPTYTLNFAMDRKPLQASMVSHLNSVSLTIKGTH